MSYLLDTHVFIWLAVGDSRLSESAIAVCRDHTIEKWISAASVWEMAIKSSLGRLQIDKPFAEFVEQGMELTSCKLLGIDVRHTVEIIALPSFHRDPFDRMLIAQARVEGLTLLTTDHEIKRYDVPTAW